MGGAIADIISKLKIICFQIIFLTLLPFVENSKIEYNKNGGSCSKQIWQ